MPDRSVPIEIGGKQYHLRFSNADKKAVERDFGGMGLLFLFQRERAGVTTFSSFLHRGLYKENERGDLVHAFTQDPDGNNKAADVLEEYTSTRDLTCWLELHDIFFHAFVVSGICRDPSAKEEEKTPKNETPPAS